MNNTIKTAVAFVLGAAAGSFITWKIVSKKYETILQEEIDSVKEFYGKRKEEPKTETIVEARETYTKKISDLGYVSAPTEPEAPKKAPYVIPPEEFANSENAVETLRYYSNGIVTDDCDNVIEDVEDRLGPDFAQHFGKYEDPYSVYVRNESRCIDYEIILQEDPTPVTPRRHNECD